MKRTSRCSNWMAPLLMVLLLSPQQQRSSADKNSIAPPVGPAAVAADIVDATLKQLNSLSWGAGGKFAGFTGLNLNRQYCDYLYNPNYEIYANATEYQQVMATQQAQIAKTYRDTVIKTLRGYASYQFGVYVTTSAVHFAYYLPLKLTNLLCEVDLVSDGQTGVSYDLPGRKLLTNVVEDTAAVGEMAISKSQIVISSTLLSPEDQVGPNEKVSARYVVAVASQIELPESAGDKVIKFFQKAEKFRFQAAIFLGKVWDNGLFLIGKKLVLQLIAPLKQCGAVVELLGKLTRQKGIEEAGKSMRTLMSKPTKVARDTMKSTSKSCIRAVKYLDFMFKVHVNIDRIVQLTGFINNFGLVPFSYIKCAEQEGLISQALAEVRAGTSSTPTGRKLQQVFGTRVTTLAAELQHATDNLQVATSFDDAMQTLRDSIETQIVDPVSAFMAGLESLHDLAEQALSELNNVVAWFEAIPQAFLDAILSFANTLAGYLADCPDYICNFGSWLSDLLNQLIDDCIASLHIDGVSSLADLFIKALSYVVPIPSWFTGDIPSFFDLPDVSITDLDSVLNTLQQFINSTVSQAEGALLDAVNKLASIQLGTTIYEMSSDLTAAVIQRKSTTVDDTISIECPDNRYVYVTSFLVNILPNCFADYTQWLRTPCSGSSCSVDWTKYNWKCYQVTSPSLPLQLPSRAITATYDCVTQAGLANYRLLPELLSASKTGETTLKIPQYQSGYSSPADGYKIQPENNLPAVWNLAAFASEVGPDASLISTAATGQPQSSPPYDSYSFGALQYPLLNPFYERDGYTPVEYSCQNFAPFGLPTLLIEGIDVDACYNTQLWQQVVASFPQQNFTNKRSYTAAQVLTTDRVEKLRSDMCGWRVVAKRGFTGASIDSTKNLLKNMTPPMLLPWAAAPNGQQFGDFWVPRGACEYFDGGAAGRSHFANKTWRVNVEPSIDACAAKLIGPDCAYYGSTDIQVFCDTRTQSSGWPFINPANDPGLKDGTWAYRVCNNPPSPTQFYPCNNGRVPISLWCGPRGKDSSAPDVASSVLSGYTSKLRFYFGDTGSNTAYAPIPDFELPQYQLTTVAQQWASECSLEYTRRLEFQARRTLHEKYTQQDTTLPANCRSMLDSCQNSNSSCPISELFRCSRNLGIIQFACIGASGGSSSTTTTLVFKDSLVTGLKVISCGTGMELSIKSAELGQGRVLKSVLSEVIKQLCNADGTSCTLNINHPALNSQAGDVLQVVSTCACKPGYEAFQNGTTCQPCAAGQYRSATSASCTAAPPGTYTNATGTADPIPCPAGTFSADYGAFTCTPCSPGTYSTAVGASNTSTCQPCIGNNVYSPSGSAACSICSPGTVLFRSAWSSNDTTNNAACLACPAGSYRSATMDKCTACNPGTYAPQSGASSCLPAPAGTYAAQSGTITPSPCLTGYYQPSEGQTSCIKCEDGMTTNGFQATNTTACILAPVIPPDQLQEVQRLSKLQSTGRRLLGDTSACDDLIAKLVQLNLGTASSLQAEVGNGICNPGPLNDAACNYDGGDCCPSTCRPVCAQLDSSSDDPTTPDTFVVVATSCSPASFQCLDPVALQQSGTPPLNCSGIQQGPNTLLQQLSTPVAKGQTVDVQSVLSQVDPASAAGANGVPGVCDPERNTVANKWDDGDCCRQSCITNPQVATSCTNFMCLDPTYANGTNTTLPAVDVRPPSIRAPADYSTTCGAVLSTQVLTAYDEVDGIIQLAAPTVTSTAAGAALGATLPCTGASYTVQLKWSTKDKAGNSASAVQTVYVASAVTCDKSQLPALPNNTEAYSCNDTASRCTATCSAGFSLSAGTLTTYCLGRAWSTITGLCTAGTGTVNCTSIPYSVVNSNGTACECQSGYIPTYDLSGNLVRCIVDTSRGRAVADKASVVSGTWATIDVLANDIGNASTILAVTNSTHGTVKVRRSRDKSDLLRYLSLPGYIGLDRFSYTTAAGTAQVTVQVKPGSCAINACGSRASPGGQCNRMGRCVCPQGTGTVAKYVMHPVASARAVTPMIPACRYEAFIPTGHFTLSKLMKIKRLSDLEITFTLGGPAATTCLKVQPLMSVALLWVATCPTASEISAEAAADTEEPSDTSKLSNADTFVVVGSAGADSKTTGATGIKLGCMQGVYSASIHIRSRKGYCYRLFLWLADGGIKRGVVQVV